MSTPVIVPLYTDSSIVATGTAGATGLEGVGENISVDKKPTLSPIKPLALSAN